MEYEYGLLDVFWNQKTMENWGLEPEHHHFEKENRLNQTTILGLYDSSGGVYVFSSQMWHNLLVTHCFKNCISQKVFFGTFC